MNEITKRLYALLALVAAPLILFFALLWWGVILGSEQCGGTVKQILGAVKKRWKE